MTTTPDFGDLPIDAPEKDLFGLDPFVKALARSIGYMKTPHGVVIALNGPWGSGKSSAINLLKHHLTRGVQSGSIQIVSFNPWWFRGEEALVLAFFRELYAATKPSLSGQARKVLPKLGARLLKAGGVVAPTADALGASGAGAIAAGAMGWLSGLIEDGDSVERLHTELAEALGGQPKRFVVLIDDIDRLAPDEALAMFRLVKSVGRLPNVIYVLAFDRILAERIVAERFPSEGPHYLEKIVQASFELPAPAGADLQQHLQAQIFEIAGTPDERQIVHVMNLFYEVVAPAIRTPRDVVRFVNAFAVTWPAVAGEVDLGDFIALETYRLFRPRVYQAIRANSALVCGPASHGLGQSTIKSEELDAKLVPDNSEVARTRRGLMRLFPKLESLWSNVYHSRDATWAKQRRACVVEHFPTYFRLSLPEDTLPRADIEALITHRRDPNWISERLIEAVSSPRRNGGTKAALILDALTLHAAEIPIEDAELFLRGVFAVADTLDVEADRARGFDIGNNSLRIHWLLRETLFDRTELSERSRILMRAIRDAPIGWLVDFASSAWEDYHPREGREAESEAKCLLTAADASKLRTTALKAIRRAAKDGSLIKHPDLAGLLYRWRDFAEDEGVEARRWTTSRLKEDESVVRIAATFTSHSWGQGMGVNGLGDLVAKRTDRAQIRGIEDIMDRTLLRSRVEELANSLPGEDPGHAIVNRFLAAWRAQEAGRD